MDKIRQIIREEIHKVMHEQGLELGAGDDPVQNAEEMIQSNEEQVKALQDELKFRQADSRVSNLPKDEKKARDARTKVVKDRLEMAEKELELAKQSQINAIQFQQMQTDAATQQQGQSQVQSQIAESDESDDKIGKQFWFEYHCDESTSSCDYHLFLRSHQKVQVLSRGQDDHDEFPEEPKVYEVKFEDGFKASVFDDELMSSPEEFYRPDPPKEV